MKTILLVGACGSGKTWVMLELIKRLQLTKERKIGLFWYRLHRDEIKHTVGVLGYYDGSTYQGSDRLSMAVMKDCDKFKTMCKQKIIIAEGDRFTNSTFIKAFYPYIIKITGDGSRGRALRKSNQSERQIKAIQTRVNNIPADCEVPNSTIALKEVLNIIQNN